MKNVYYDQSQFFVRCEWGLNGLIALREKSDLLIIVDVLSFSTAVEIATSQGAIILPYSHRDESLDAYAKEKNAIVASRRGTPGKYTLSPSSLLDISNGCRLVLPSPNGSRLSLDSMDRKAVAGCIRNANAVAAFAKDYNSIGIIPCGERWPDGSLRPAFEDLLGAGAIIAALSKSKSLEAIAAEAAFLKCESSLFNSILQCSSGRELDERGYIEDVVLASQHNSSSTVPILMDSEYRKAFARSGV